MAVVLLVVLVAPLRSRVETLVRAATIGGGLNEVLTGRLDAWWVAERLLQEHPLAGVGFGAYRAEFAAAKLRLISEGVPFFAGHLNPSFANAHNEYLEVGADLGWPGLLALVWGAALVLRAAWRARRHLSRADRALSWGALVRWRCSRSPTFRSASAPGLRRRWRFCAWLLANEGGEAIAPGRRAGSSRPGRCSRPRAPRARRARLAPHRVERPRARGAEGDDGTRRRAGSRHHAARG